MEPLAVVKEFDPFKDGGLGFRVGDELAAMDEFAFEAAPEAFHGGIVIAVAGSAHAGDDPGPHELLPVGGTGVLAATIRMMDQPRRWPALLQRHLQGGQWQ